MNGPTLVLVWWMFPGIFIPSCRQPSMWPCVERVSWKKMLRHNREPGKRGTRRELVSATRKEGEARRQSVLWISCSYLIPENELLLNVFSFPREKIHKMTNSCDCLDQMVLSKWDRHFVMLTEEKRTSTSPFTLEKELGKLTVLVHFFFRPLNWQLDRIFLPSFPSVLDLSVVLLLSLCHFAPQKNVMGCSWTFSPCTFLVKDLHLKRLFLYPRLMRVFLLWTASFLVRPPSAEAVHPSM